ncbi:MAG: hypothetical protein AAFQ05_09090, partial [Pseudomonadota bacterium]
MTFTVRTFQRSTDPSRSRASHRLAGRTQASDGTAPLGVARNNSGAPRIEKVNMLAREGFPMSQHDQTYDTQDGNDDQ